MAKLGSYSYPDIRFGDAVEIAGRILSKFKGTVSVKGMAWELGMAENSGTLFAKVAALRDFGLVDGRGELKVTGLAQRIIHPATAQEARQARAEAFQRVELLRILYERFQGEVPDDASLLIGLEEVAKAPRDEIIRRAGLIQKHLTDAVRVLSRPVPQPAQASAQEPSGQRQQTFYQNPATTMPMMQQIPADASGIYLVAGGARLAAPLTPDYVDVAIDLLRALKVQLETGEESLCTESQDSGDSTPPKNGQEMRLP